MVLLVRRFLLKPLFTEVPASPLLPRLPSLAHRLSIACSRKPPPQPRGSPSLFEPLKPATNRPTKSNAGPTYTNIDGETDPAATTKDPVMSMLIPLQKTLKAVAATLDRRSPVYDEARSRHRELAPHANAREVLAALRSSSALSPSERDALLATVLTEHQRAPQPVWQSILLVAFEPLLVRIRKSINRKPDADNDQQVFLGFLEAICSVRVGHHTLLALRWLTEAHVEGAVRKDSLAVKDHKPYNDERATSGPFSPTFQKVAAAEIMDLIERRGGRALLEAIVATDAHDEPLTEYVARAYADLSEHGRASTYDRLWRGRNKVLAELRQRVALQQPIVATAPIAA